MNKPDFEEILEALVNEFDTSGSIFTYTTSEGDEVEVSESTGLILEQALLALYGGESVYDANPYYEDEND